MAKNFLISIVCLSFIVAEAQVTMSPVAAAEKENRLDYIQYFSQPAQLRVWETNDDTEEAWKRWEVTENFSFGKNRGSIPMIVDLQSLHPYFRDRIIELIKICHSKGIELAIVETYRTHTKQREYKSMGRRYTRSGPGSSKHQYGLAIDVVPMVDSTAQWNNITLWRKVGVIGERLGLRWGGRWRHPFDPGHFEWTGGLGTYYLAQGVFPAIPKSSNYPCIEEDLLELKRHWRAWETEQSAVARKEPIRTVKKYRVLNHATGGGDD